jgi:hypothetical protein
LSGVIEFVRGDLAAVGRTTMTHADHHLLVTLYPVLHIGSPSFYAALSEDLKRFRVFLLEGVRWRWKGALYDLAARNLGLVTQRTHPHLPDDSERLPLDMSPAEFSREAERLPMRWRLALRLVRPILWAMTATEWGRHRVWDSFSKESVYATLRQCGFEKGSVRWFEVLDGLTIPTRGTHGRARGSVT